MTEPNEQPDAQAGVAELLPLALRGAILSLIGLAVAGLPAAWFLAGAAGRGDLQLPAVVTGGIVIAASFAGLVPLWLTREADPMTRAVTGKLGHMMVRLLLTAGGLVFYLVSQPEALKFPAGLIALAWYLVGWVLEWIFLYRQPTQAPR